MPDGEHYEHYLHWLQQVESPMKLCRNVEILGEFQFSKLCLHAKQQVWRLEFATKI
jgi:hypothetical protein